ncbi:MAG TPA: histidine phosphatase family protein [Actinomycetaceae bacterium]|nr:histidine phosphatase family protein [Actinomycetaceae bacterium]
MTAGRIVLWRHGQTDYNLEGRCQGRIDIELNAEGRRQAAAGAAALTRFLGERRVGAIVASDLMRARVTAEHLCRALGMDVVLDSRLRERSFGVFEGLSGTEIERHWASEYRLWKSGETPPGIGFESKGSAARRVAAAVEDHAAPLGAHETLVVVGHGSALSQTLVWMLGDDPERGSQLCVMDNCHWAELRHQPDRRPVWQLRAHNVGAVQ